MRPRCRTACINGAFSRFTGLCEADVVGRLVSEVIPEPARASVLARYRACVRERRTITWDEVTVYPAGPRHGAVSIAPVFDDDGTCTTLVGTVHDVTERMAAEERIRAQAALLDRANDAILVRDLDGTVRYWNEGATRVYGWTAAEAVGRRVTDLLYRGTEAFDRAQRQVVDGGSWKGELEQTHKSGRAVTVEGSWTLLRDDDGNPRSVLAINTDVTERKKVERHLLRVQRMNSLGELAGAIAHDFNNILAAILGNATLGKAEATDDQSVQCFDEIEKAGARASSLVRQILTFSRDQAPRRERMSLAAIVEEALGLIRVTAPRHISIATTIAPEVPAILAEPTQIHQVVMNLCTNAVHAIGETAGRIGVRVEGVVLEQGLVESTAELLPGAYARLTVEDTGKGMSEAVLERIFDPFFTTKEAGKGTGLGLSVVHGIMRSHGGGILVRSAPGAGSTFTLYFSATPQA